MAIKFPIWGTDQDAASNQLHNLADGTAPKDAINLSQLTAATGGDTWQPPIKDQVDFTTSEPVGPSIGDRYINTATGVSSVTAQAVTATSIYEWDGATWVETPAEDGFATYDQAQNDIYTFNGTAWVASHGTYVTDYFVSDDIGDDSNDGLNQTRSFKTLGACLDAVETAAVNAAIHILDDSTYIVTESSGTPGIRDLGVRISIDFPHATLTGQGGGVAWKLGDWCNFNGFQADGTNLTFEPSGSGVKDFNINVISNPTFLWVPTKSGGGSIGGTSVLCHNVNGVGGIADYAAPARSGSFRFVAIGNISTSTTDALRIYDFISEGSNISISATTWNYDSRNNGAGDMVPILVENGGRAWYYFDCIGSVVAGVVECNGATCDVFGSASDAFTGAPLDILGTHPEEVHDWSWSQGMNFDKLSTTTAVLTDLINIRDVSLESQRQITLSDLQTLIAATEDLAETLIEGNTSGANDIIMSNQQKVQFNVVGNYIREKAAAGAVEYTADKGHEFNVGTAQAVIGLVASTFGRTGASNGEFVLTYSSGVIQYTDVDTGFQGNLDIFQALTATRTWTMPDKSGTVSLEPNVVSKVFGDSPYTAANCDVVLYDATGGNSTVNLPAAASNANAKITVKKIDASANTVTIDGNLAETIDGTTTKVLTTQYQSLTMVCDGSNWFII